MSEIKKSFGLATLVGLAGTAFVAGIIDSERVTTDAQSKAELAYPQQFAPERLMADQNLIFSFDRARNNGNVEETLRALSSPEFVQASVELAKEHKRVSDKNDFYTSQRDGYGIPIRVRSLLSIVGGVIGAAAILEGVPRLILAAQSRSHRRQSLTLQ